MAVVSLAFAAVFLSAACMRPATPTPQPRPYAERLSALAAALDACSARTGYRPPPLVTIAPKDDSSRSEQAPPEDQPTLALQAAETAWRSCAHGAVRATMQPQNPLANLYEALIATDAATADAVAAGHLRAADRSDRLRHEIALIDVNERLAETARAAAAGEAMLRQLAERDRALGQPEGVAVTQRLVADIARRLSGGQ